MTRTEATTCSIVRHKTADCPSDRLEKLALADGSGLAQDSVSAVELDHELGKEAREVEVTFFRKTKAYARVPLAMQWMTRRTNTGVRWVDVSRARVQDKQGRRVVRLNALLECSRVCCLASVGLDAQWGTNTCHGECCQGCARSRQGTVTSILNSGRRQGGKA